MQAIAVRADKNIEGYTKLTLPLIEGYAKKWNATLEIIDSQPPVWTDDRKPHYRIMDVHRLLDKYDRVACIDADMVILPACPNPFEAVDEDKIGSIYEDKGSRRAQRHQLIQEIQSAWGDIGWKTGYTNAGIFVVSKQHQDIFTPFKGQYWTGWGSADLHLSYKARKNGHTIQELPFQWNHMTMFSESWNRHANRFDSYIIHYAGRGTFNQGSRIKQIIFDIERVYGKDTFHYPLGG